ncbi:hypothetical protein KP509_03G032200 [Ceratopteris richardii]|nr:hypothetical protein KP509_03G032200 [Ceratopteris richardii]
MADVVQHEQFNKMNARNIAMVFAPNMIKKSDPLTALVHVVEIMNLLKSLVLMTIKGREEAALKAILEPSCKESKHEIIHRQESVQSHGTALVTESYCKNDYVFSARDIQSESFVDSRPLCGLKDIFSKHCRTVDVTEEGDTCFDDQIPLSNSPAKLDSADGDGQNMSWQSANNYNDMYISGLLLSDLKESVHANERQKARRGHLGNPFAGTSGIVSMQCRSLH